MNRFIAYFDYLGFKEFIENNDLEFQSHIMNNNFRDMESALGLGKHKEAKHGFIADTSKSLINCINFSDTVVFFTNDSSEESLMEILKVAYIFNWKTNVHFFPVRGALVFGELEYVNYNQINDMGAVYNINSAYGKGLVKAHLRADEQNWAGSVLDESFVSEIKKRGYDLDTLLLNYAKKYYVPYKNKVVREEEYVLNLINGVLDDEGFNRYSADIRNNFAQYNKSVDEEGVQLKISNTISFLKSYCEEAGKVK